METAVSGNKMGVGKTALFSLCAVIVLDTLTAAAAMGPSAIGWWIVTFIVFVIPYGLITSELSTTYPGDGGIYDWVQRAFGQRWAARTSWYYWINTGLWMPSAYILFAGMFAELYVPDLAFGWQLAICVALTWLTIAICSISTDIGVWVTNVCAFLKVFVILLLGCGGFWYAYQHGIANHFSIETMMPSLDNGAAFLPALVFNLMGLELVATLHRQMRNTNDMPKAVFLTAGATALLYLFGTIGILAALPVEDIGLIAGIVDTLKTLFGDSELGQFMVAVIGGLTLLTFIGNMVTWTMGSSRTAAEAAQDGELPACVAKRSKRFHTPIGANIITGLVSTAVLFVYASFAGSGDSLFWSLFAFSSCVFLLPYLMMFPAHLKLRLINGQRYRPFKVWGGIGWQWCYTILCTAVIMQALVLFTTPDIYSYQIDWNYTSPILIGLLLTITIGEFLVTQSTKNWEAAVSPA